MTMREAKIELLKGILVMMEVALAVALVNLCFRGCAGRKIPAGIGMEKSA